MSKFHRRRSAVPLAEQLKRRGEELGLVVPDTTRPSRIKNRPWLIAATSADPAEAEAMASWRAENGIRS